MTFSGMESHFPILAAVVARTTGPVLECGMGYGSTPMLHLMCKGRRELTSLDSDSEWMGKFAYLVSEEHRHGKIQGGVDAWVAYCRSLDPAYYAEGVIFVDNAPGDARVPMIAALKGKARFIVAHDTEADIPPSSGTYGWEKLDGCFKYQSTWKEFRPWTTVYSDLEKFEL